MNRPANPVVERYLARFERSLGKLGESERREMCRELDNHIAEALHAGDPLEEVLATLGPADRLAAAYRAELAAQGTGREPTLARTLGVIGVIATTSVPTFIIVSVLLVIGVGFTLSGLLAVVLGPLGLVLPDSMIEIRAPWPTPFAELSAVVLGLFLIVAGILALLALYGYVRMVRAALRRLLAGVRAQP